MTCNNNQPLLCTGSGCRTPPELPCFLRLHPGSSGGEAPTCFGEPCEVAEANETHPGALTFMFAFTGISDHSNMLHNKTCLRSIITTIAK